VGKPRPHERPPEPLSLVGMGLAALAAFLCCALPAAMGWLGAAGLGAVFGWVTGTGPLLAIAVTAVLAAVVFAAVRALRPGRSSGPDQTEKGRWER
jgi:membrane protein implicated in regulation of membrane protease activity